LASDPAVIARGEWHPANSSHATPSVLRAENGRLIAEGEGTVLAMAVPESFTLELSDGRRFECDIRWRRINAIGVEFRAA